MFTNTNFLSFADNLFCISCGIQKELNPMRKGENLCFICHHDYFGGPTPSHISRCMYDIKRFENLEKLNSDENQVKELILVLNEVE
jgi:hypothetical protein